MSNTHAGTVRPRICPPSGCQTVLGSPGGSPTGTAQTCWTRERETATGSDRHAWLAERRAEELSAVETWETKAGMPPLGGSDKAVEWARKVRHQLVAAAFDDMGSPDDADFTEQVEAPARMVVSASWRIDQRDADT